MKRPYTPTDRSRAASRRNIAIARAAWLRMRTQPGFQPSERQKQAAHRNLLRAVAHNLRDRSHRYARCFRHGLRAVSLERSLKLAGEKLADYRAHVQWCCGVFARGFAPGSDAAKLARGLAYASWRRLHGMRTTGEWERLAVCVTLRRAALLRRRGAARGAEALVSLIEMLCGVLGEQFFVVPKLRRVENRMEALAAKLIELRGGEPLHWRARRSAVVDERDAHPAEVLGNPLVPAHKVEGALEPREAQVKPPGAWAGWVAGGSANPAAALGEEHTFPRDNALLSRARSLREAGRQEAPATFEEFLELVREAVGAGEPSPVGGDPSTNAGGASACVEAGRGTSGCRRPQKRDKKSRLSRGARAGRNGSSGHRPAPGGEGGSADAARVLEVARALWDRLEVYRRRAGYEARTLRELCEDYPASLDSEPDGGPGDGADPCALVRRVVGELMAVEGVVRDVRVARYRLERAWYGLLVERHGEQSEFADLKPEPPDHTHLLISALLAEAGGNEEAGWYWMDEYERLEAGVERRVAPG